MTPALVEDWEPANMGNERTESMREMARSAAETWERYTLCLGGEPNETIHHGQTNFRSTVEELYGVAESNAAEQFVVLKSRLARLEGDDFWSLLTKDVANILGAQYSIVSKRILPGNVESLLEMPDMDAPGSCFSAVSMYFNDGTQERHTQGFEYPAKGTLCAHMKHDKVFLVPSHLAEYIGDQAANFEVPVESHFAIPFCDKDGRCFAHLGVFWSVEGERARKLSWGFIEMMLHAIEDLGTQRLLASQQVGNHAAAARRPVRPCPSRTPTSSLHSLKPYARSLSHELRTPMHGVVGMLDIMHVTVQEALESTPNEDVASLFRTLKDNIETIQDSSRRAVEAADNIVHAYDFDMQVPERDGAAENTAAVVEEQTVAAELTSPPLTSSEQNAAPPKRRRSGSMELSSLQPSPKHRIIDLPPRSATPNMVLTPHTGMLHSIVKESSTIAEADSAIMHNLSKPDTESLPHAVGTKFSRVREIIQVVVSESLRVGGRPDSAIATETEFGEHIEVRNRGSNGHASTKTIDWSVEPSVPEELQIDERDFAKLVSVLFLNALKFTQQGSIRLHMSLTPRSHFVVLNVMDTGMGIPIAFRPYLFKAFARGDDSLTRPNEGLGLGLMVAKSLARRVGGDLVCVRSDTRGPNQGSEFELRIPLHPVSEGSPSRTPSRTPTPTPRFRSLTPTLPEPGTAPSDAAAEMDAVEPTAMPYFPRLDPPLDDTPPTADGSATATLHDSATSISSRQSQTAPSSEAASVSAAQVSPTTPNIHMNIAGTATMPPHMQEREHGPFARALAPIPSIPPTLPHSQPHDLLTPRRLSQTLPQTFDRALASKFPLNIMVAEDNKINRKLLVAMLRKLGYRSIHEAFDGAEAVRLMEMDRRKPAHAAAGHIDLILMDLWMPQMDGYEATRRILAMQRARSLPAHLKILAVTADVTDAALDRARAVGMHGIMTKPYNLVDLERLIIEHGSMTSVVHGAEPAPGPATNAAANSTAKVGA